MRIVQISLVLNILLVCTLASLGFADDKIPSGSNGQKYQLKYKHQPNQYVHHRVKHNVSITTQYGGVTQVIENETITRKHYRTISVSEDGTTLLELMIDAVQMSAKSDAGKEVKFDSINGAKNCPPQFRHILATIGKPLGKIEFSPTGKLVNIAGKGNEDQETAAEDVAEHNFLIVFPEQELAVGDTWQDQFQVAVNVTERLKKQVVIRRTYRLDSVENGLATIDLKTTVITPIKNPRIEAQLLQRTPGGKIVFDMKRGAIRSRETHLDNVVLNPFGEKSSMRAVSTRTETLLSDEEVAELNRLSSGVRLR